MLTGIPNMLQRKGDSTHMVAPLFLPAHYHLLDQRLAKVNGLVLCIVVMYKNLES